MRLVSIWSSTPTESAQPAFAGAPPAILEKGKHHMAFAVQLETTADPFKRDELTALIPRMRAFALSLCRDHAQADDLTQDTLVSAWRRRDSYQQGTNLRAWIFMIMRNQFYSDKRRSWRVLQLDPTVAEETLIAVSNPAAALELDDVRRAMLSLSAAQREALTMIAVHGMGYTQVARLCKCAEGTIKSRVSRARQALLATMDDKSLRGDRGAPGEAMAAIFNLVSRVPGQAFARDPAWAGLADVETQAAA